MQLTEAPARFYWLPFPGAWQCVLTVDGQEHEGMGASKTAARETAERIAQERKSERP